MGVGLLKWPVNEYTGSSDVADLREQESTVSQALKELSGHDG